MGLEKWRQAREQPFGREAGGRPDVQERARTESPNAGCGFRDPIHAGADEFEIAFAHARQLDAPTCLRDQDRPQEGLEQVDLLADCGRRHAEFHRGLGNTARARHGMEYGDGPERYRHPD